MAEAWERIRGSVESVDSRIFVMQGVLLVAGTAFLSVTFGLGTTLEIAHAVLLFNAGVALICVGTPRLWRPRKISDTFFVVVGYALFGAALAVFALMSMGGG